MKKKLLSLLLMMVLAIPISFGLSGMTAYADDGDYIKINNADDLYKVNNDLSSNYMLMCDIDISEEVAEGGKYNSGGRGWSAIGAASSTEFTGIFDGNGHTISGLSITGSANSTNINGLFWKNNGIIKNLTVTGTINYESTSNGDYISGLIVGVNNGDIIGCISNGTIHSGNCSGVTSGLITGENSGSIGRCMSKGSIILTASSTGSGGQWGGICGYSKATSTITECLNNADVTYRSGYQGKGSAGGIAGLTDSSVKIDNCYNTGDIKGRYYGLYDSSTPTIVWANGISGGTCSIANCYNTGDIKCDYSVGNNYFTAFYSRACNYIGKGSASNCYYLGGSGDGSLNETQMTMVSSFTGFDFDKVWELSAATDYKYPQLRNNMQDPNKHVDIIEWKTQPTKIDFYTDEDIDPTGGVFTAYYIDDTHEDIEVTKDMLSGYDMSQLGVQTVTVTFREGSLTYDILTSTRPEVKTLTLETMPNKTEFARGTAFDFTGATAKVEYVNGKTDIVPIPTDECTGGDITKSGTYTITFEKFGKSITFDVKVVPVKPTGIRIASLPDKTTYIEGQSLDLTGMVVKLDYNSGKTETITDYTVGEYTNTIGTKEITITYEDFSTSFNVEFVEKKLTNIIVTTQPTKAKYVVGEKFDNTGMVVKAVYDNGISEEITDYTVSEITDATGWQNLTVSYEGKTTTVKVMVEAKELVSIFVAQMPTKTTYIEGEKFDPEGMVVKANYNNVLEEAITDYTLSGTTLNKVGESKITVLYEGMTATFNVTVVEKQLVKITVTPPTKTDYIAGEELDKTGMVVNAVYDNGKSEEVTDYTVSGFGDSEEDNVVTIEYGGKTSAFIVTIHTPEDKWTVTQAPSCTTGGSQELHCADCGKILKTENVDALGHDWSEWETVEAPKCTDKGSQKRTCSRCNQIEYKDVDPAGHTWETEYTVDKQPSCTEEGSESLHCAECGVINPESVRAIEKLPHELGDWTVTKEATCAVAGVKQRVCAHCDYLETEEIPATGNHEYGEWKVIKEATCTEAGSKDRECTVCHKVESEVIPVTNHDWSNTYTVDKEATCTAAGSESIHCTKCDAIKEGSIKEIPIKAHSFGAWQTTKVPTEISAGQKACICSVCGFSEKQSIAMLKPTLPAVKITTPKAAKKAATIKWKKVSKKNQKKIAKIEIQYSMYKNFKSGVKKVYAKKSTTSKKISKLKSKKTYYVRIRAYKKSSGAVHVSKWSTVKRVKAK